MGCIDIKTTIIKTKLDITLSLFCNSNGSEAITTDVSIVNLDTEGNNVVVNIFSNIDWNIS